MISVVCNLLTLSYQQLESIDEVPENQILNTCKHEI